MTERDTSASAGPGTAKDDPEELKLRAAPRRAVRFKRGIIIAIAALGSGAIFGITMMALRGPMLQVRQKTEELYHTENNQTAEGLATLPADYSELEPDTPVLGPPLPGDLGGPILERQRQLGIAPGQDVSAEEQRLAQQAIQARESEIFFRIENRPDPAGSAEREQIARSQSGMERIQDSGPSMEGDSDHQHRKRDFIDQRETGGIYNPHGLQTPASSHQLMAGSVIAVSLMTGISDLPGLVVAQITEDVYDTVTGSVLLIRKAHA